jgi:hypothetical protein
MPYADAARRITSTARPCERLCPTCGQLQHYSRFARRLRQSPNRSVWEFDLECRACQQKARNIQKNTDRARAIIEGRASVRARELGVTREHLLVRMNWNSLVPILRALMTPEGRCVSCGHVFINERDIQIEHREPPRHDHDWARESARNIGFLCCSCNRAKSNKPFPFWLDEQEDARLSNEGHSGRSEPDSRKVSETQLTLWD